MTNAEHTLPDSRATITRERFHLAEAWRARAARLEALADAWAPHDAPYTAELRGAANDYRSSADAIEYGTP